MKKHSLCWDTNPLPVDSSDCMRGLSRKNFTTKVRLFFEKKKTFVLLPAKSRKKMLILGFEPANCELRTFVLYPLGHIKQKYWDNKLRVIMNFPKKFQVCLRNGKSSIGNGVSHIDEKTKSKTKEV